MPDATTALPDALRALRRSVTAEASAQIKRWRKDIAQPSFAGSADNLAHYLALRHHDLRALHSW